MWWWVLPHAPGVPERLIVGHERAFLTWFYEQDPSSQAAIEPEAVSEYLRTFAGREGVLGALGVYRAVFSTMEQTVPLKERKVRVPMMALGGFIRGLIELVAEDVGGGAIPDCAHFVVEERPEEITQQILGMTARTSGRPAP